jgi:glycosyltransferase involved in cell wall biosynthesis
VARLGEAWIITRPRNREAIEAALPGLPERDRLHFVYVEVRKWPKSWRTGKGRSSIDYLLWQPVAMREARRLHQDLRFDLAWHLTFANAWLGSLGGRAGPPFVYGPVGGGVGNPWRLLPGHGLRGSGYELVRAVGRTLGRYINPLARIAWSNARIILVQNPETRDWLPARHRSRARVCPNPILDERFPFVGGVLEEKVVGKSGSSGPIALYAGRLVAWKGMFLALRAVASLPEWRLVVCGKGPDAKRLHRLARKLGVQDRVQFHGFIPRADLMRLMREEADVLLFPSLHDEAGWVVAEAEACRLPVVCLDRGGPPLLGGRGVELTSIAGTADALARAIDQARREGRPTGVDRGRRWSLPARAAELAGILSEAGLTEPLSVLRAPSPPDEEPDEGE